MDPQTPIDNLPGVGSYYGRRLKKLEINTIEDLIYHFPFRYDDFSQISTISNITPGEKISIQGVIWQIKNIRTRKGKYVTTATVADQSSTIEVIWFNQPYLTKTLKAGTPISLSGKVQLDGYKPKLISPSYEIIRHDYRLSTIDYRQTLHTGRLVPIYPETESLSSKWLRQKIANVIKPYLKSLVDHLPGHIIEKQNLPTLSEALQKIHFPKTYQDIEISRKRLGFDEIFQVQILSLIRQREWKQNRKAPRMQINRDLLQRFKKTLPFVLTSAQQKATEQILKDLTQQKPANRLLEGDVGSGKTVVAAAAALIAFDNGYDSLVAAPTEILAFQHQKTLEQLLAPFKIKVGIWTAGKKQKGDVTCGTHALLMSFSAKRKVGFVVVDEQHRFGVAQRAKLFMDHSQHSTPHLLTMTATPIPRTLALTLYGDLDLSVLDEMPKGRQKISTFVVPNFKRSDAHKFIENQVREGEQAFILTPFVEPSETMETVKSATDEFEKLQKVFSTPNPSAILNPSISLRAKQSNLKSANKRSFAPQSETQDDKRGKVRLGLLHGRLKSKEKESIINQFKANKINILVATPVVEVGIDVPNATIMLIESAERFGLAQLHQLRGRVGRGKHKSHCFLFTDSRAENSVKRLKSMEKVHVGFELAEIDLKMRGAGEIFGLKQSGFFNFKVADITDRTTIVAAQSEAKKLLNENPDLTDYPQLKQKLNSLQHQYSQPN